jgi:hypothetical protein
MDILHHVINRGPACGPVQDLYDPAEPARGRESADPFSHLTVSDFNSLEF